MNKKTPYENPRLRIESVFTELGFALSSPDQWNDGGNGSGDFNVDSDYDNEFE